MKNLLLLCVFSIVAGTASLAQVFTIPYYEDFESGAPGWTATTGSPSNWELGTPSFGNTSSAHSGTQCWEVDLDSGYANASNCFLDAPPFNFGNNPSIRISMWQNRSTETYWDGVVMLYRTDTTSPVWNVLGSMGASGSMNWYNSNSINSSGLPAWVGDSSGWYQASIVIPNIFGNDDVYFRFRFSSDNSVTFDGFSIDDFSIEPASACFVTGNLYRDINNNLVIDTSDVPLTGYRVNSSFGGNQGFTFTDASGSYYLVTDTGVVTTVTPDPLLYHTNVPANYSVTLSTIGQVSAGNDFLFSPMPDVIDVWATHNSTFFRPTFNTTHAINYGNLGTDTVSGSIFFNHNSFVSMVSATVPYTQISPQSIEIPYTNLMPGETRSIQLITYTDSTAVFGDTVSCTVQILPISTDVNPSNNADTTFTFVVNSYDPNNKLVDPEGDITSAQVSSGIDLNYTINFQNTGNAPAININILDVIDDNLDLSTFSIVSTSHPLTSVQIGANRQVQFTFANINLPDSVNNEPASHGFVNYRIRPLTTLTDGAQISNSAGIYFDNNFPVITNTVITKVEDPVGISDIVSDNGISLYPNPNSGSFTILTGTELSFDSWEIYNMLGEKVEFGFMNQKHSANINTTQLTPGIYFIQLSGKQLMRSVRFVKQ